MLVVIRIICLKYVRIYLSRRGRGDILQYNNITKYQYIQYNTITNTEPWPSAGQVVLEAGDQVVPGGGVELLRADLPLTAEFNENLQRTHLESLR